MTCVNACSDKKYCFRLKPYYNCGHVMCFNSAMAFSWCIQCACKTRNEASLCYAFNAFLKGGDVEKKPKVDK